MKVQLGTLTKKLKLGFLVMIKEVKDDDLCIRHKVMNNGGKFYS